MPLSEYQIKPYTVKVLQFEGTLDSVMELIEAFPFSLDFLKRVYKVEFGEDYDESGAGEFLYGITYSPLGDGFYEVSVPTANGYAFANRGDVLVACEGGVSHLIDPEIFEERYERIK